MHDEENAGTRSEKHWMMSIQRLGQIRDLDTNGCLARIEIYKYDGEVRGSEQLAYID